MTDRSLLPTIRFAAVAAIILAVAGIRDTSVALATPIHVVTVSSAPVEFDAPATNATENAEPAVTSAEPTPTPVPVQSVERAIVHVQTNDSAGSGFVISPNHVITNAHVVGDAETATVWLSSGALRESTVVAIDQELDIAVLHVPRVPISVQPLSFADADTVLTLGTPVWAWGYPFEDAVVVAGFSRAPTVSAGIVSATRLRAGIAYIQTDAAVNPGSSGGPLLDAAGRVIGVNTLILSPGGTDPEGLNFALDTGTHLDAILALLEANAAD